MIIEEKNKELITLYKKEKPDWDNTIISSTFDNFSLKTLKETQRILKEDSPDFYIKDIKRIKSSITPFYVEIHYKGNGDLMFNDQTGTFKITFNDNSFILFSTWFHGIRMTIKHLAVSEKDTWIKYFTHLKNISQKIEYPGEGFYKCVVRETLFGSKTQYYSLRKNSFYTGKVVHQNKDEVEKDIDYFFNHVNEFLKYGTPGVRKLMLIGEPGTGKSSMAFQIGAKYSKEMNVTYCSKVSSLFNHSQMLATLDKKGLIIVEDCESMLSSGDSNLLNFLSGINQQRHKQGLLIIFTTNNPQFIDDRILRRPGRIDKVFEIGSLKMNDAALCAQIYFGKTLIKNPKEWETMFDNLTGAQIKELAHISKMKAASERKKIDRKLISDVISGMRKHYSSLKGYSKKKSKVLDTPLTKIGFVKNDTFDEEEIWTD